jgi:hypothetical protein
VNSHPSHSSHSITPNRYWLQSNPTHETPRFIFLRYLLRLLHLECCLLNWCSNHGFPQSADARLLQFNFSITWPQFVSYFSKLHNTLSITAAHPSAPFIIINIEISVHRQHLPTLGALSNDYLAVDPLPPFQYHIAAIFDTNHSNQMMTPSHGAIFG